MAAVGRRYHCRDGAPRLMKMGTTLSPWRYDVVAADTIRPDTQRRTTILHYASWANVFPIRWWSGYPSIVALSTSRGMDVIGQKATSRHGQCTSCRLAAAPYFGSPDVARISRILQAESADIPRSSFTNFPAGDIVPHESHSSRRGRVGRRHAPFRQSSEDHQGRSAHP